MEPFIGEIKLFGGNFAPRGWAFCEGQLLSIAQNSALFSILGTTYGGDGITTFALPDLRGRVAIHPGTGPGLTSHSLGQRGGAEEITLNTGNLPPHSHTLSPGASAGAAETGDPANAFPAASSEDVYSSASDTTMGESTTSSVGSGTPVSNVQPYLALNWIIALVGVFPSRS